MKDAKIALVQFEGALGEVEKNVADACELISQAAENGADLVVLPELFSTGYHLDTIGPHIVKLAEPIDGPTVRALQQAARQAGCYVIAPIALIRDVGGVPYNSAVLIDREGAVVGSYDKVHLWALERFYFRAGASYPVFDTDFGRIGIMVCYDMGFPEAARSLALQGADLIVCPSAWCVEDMDVWEINAPARALENTVFLAAVNRFGREGGDLYMPGKSMVCNPRGKKLAQLEDEAAGILYVDLPAADIDTYRVKSPYLRDRRADTYEGVTRR